ncbi:MAG: hypothetical protein N2234_06620 [Planctomycetota bacterium]|nr:hypothetical protein [Planctomycetota bacterium]
MRFCLFVVFMLSLFGCSSAPKDEPSQATTAPKTETPTTPTPPVKEQPTKITPDIGKMVTDALALRDEFYRKRILQNQFDYELLLKAISALQEARDEIRKRLEKSPADETLRDLSSRVEPELSKLNEEKIAYDLEKKSEKETEEILKRSENSKEKEK